MNTFLDDSNNQNNSQSNIFQNINNDRIEIEITEKVEETNFVYEDLVYEKEIYDQLISELTPEQQDNKYYQELIMIKVKEEIALKNEAIEIDKYDLEVNNLIKNILENNFTSSWVIPIVLDKEKIYKISEDLEGETEQQISEFYKQQEDRGIEYVLLDTEFKEQEEYFEKYKKDEFNFKKYINLVIPLQRSFIYKSDFNKKDIGYSTYLNHHINSLRYFGYNNKKWHQRIAPGNVMIQREIYDIDGKFVGNKNEELVAGERVNIVGFLFLPTGDLDFNNIQKDSQNGNLYSRFMNIGKIKKISKAKNALIYVDNHGLHDKDSVILQNTNTEPSVDGIYYNKVKVVDQNKFMLGIDLSEGKEGNSGECYSNNPLEFDTINVKKDKNGNLIVSDVEFTNPNKGKILLFDTILLEQDDFNKIVKKSIPKIQNILNINKDIVDKITNITSLYNLIDKYNFKMSDIMINEYIELNKIITRNIDKMEKYIELEDYISKSESKKAKLIEKIDFSQYFDEFNVLADKYITNPKIEEYYGKYQSYHTIYDTISNRLNWLGGQYDNGRFYYSFVNYEISKIKYGKDLEMKKVISNYEKELKEFETNLSKLSSEIEKQSKIDAFCSKRLENLPEFSIEYKCFAELIEDNYSFKFNDGQYAIINKSDKKNENGQIFYWKNNRWNQNPVLKSISDYCIFNDTSNGKELIDKLQCIYTLTDKNSVNGVGCVSFKENRLNNKYKNDFDLVNNLKSYLEYLKNNPIKIMENKMKVMENKIKIIRKMREIDEKKLEIKLKEIESKKIENQDENLFYDILSIYDNEIKYALLNELYEKDGLEINRDIYSLSSGNKISCSHHLYEIKLFYETNNELKSEIMNILLSKFGNENDGEIICTNCGKYLLLDEYDENEGISKLTGDARSRREVLGEEEMKIEQQYKEFLEKGEIAMAEGEMQERKEVLVTDFDCTKTEIKNLLLKVGIKLEQLPKIKDICIKLSTIISKIGIPLKIMDIIDIIVKVNLKLSNFIPFKIFKTNELNELKRKGVNPDKVKDEDIKEKYQNIFNLTKIFLITVYLLVIYQTSLTDVKPRPGSVSAPFEGFENELGLMFMAIVLDDLEFLTIKRTTANGKTQTIKMNKEKIKESLGKEYNKIINEKDILDRIRAKEEKQRIIEEILEEKEVIKEEEKKEVKKIDDELMNKILFGKVPFEKKKLVELRFNFIVFLIKKLTEQVISSQPSVYSNPVAYDESCCLQNTEIYGYYYKFIKENITELNFYDLIDEANILTRLLRSFIYMGSYGRYYFEKNRNDVIDLNLLRVDLEKLKKILFTTYVNEGDLRGVKHEFNENGICVITGESEKEILEKEYSDKEYYDLINFLFEKNLKLYNQQQILYDDTLELIELKKDADIALQKESKDNIEDKLINYILTTTGYQGSKEYKERVIKYIKTFGIYTKNYDNELESAKIKQNIMEEIIIRDKTYQQRLDNIKRFYIEYFRKPISMIKNKYDSNKFSKNITTMESDLSKELQKYIYDENRYVELYLNENYYSIFKKYEFMNQLDRVMNLYGRDKPYKILPSGKIEIVKKNIEIDVCYAQEICRYLIILEMNNLFEDEELLKDVKDKKYGKRLIGEFILAMFERIYNETTQFDFTSKEIKQYSNLILYQRFKDIDESLGDISDKDKIMVEKLTAIIDDEVSTDAELSRKDRLDGLRDKAKKMFMEKFDRDATEEEIVDYIYEYEKEEGIDKVVSENEYGMVVLTEEMELSEDVLEMGDNYGEVALDADIVTEF
jgi:hypothetical protein